VQTAAAAAEVLGVPRLFVEPGLVEVLDEEASPGECSGRPAGSNASCAQWYECWRCAHDDPRGHANAASLFLTARELKSTVSPLVDDSYSHAFDASTIGATIHKGESWDALRLRMDATIRKLAAQHEGKTLLFVTHGGPVDAVLSALDGRLGPSRRVNYTSLSIMEKDADHESGWRCTLESCANHIVGVEAAAPVEEADPSIANAV
jgi:broad specificity phosphatase PhoE